MKLSDYKNIKYINTQISDFCKIRNGYSFKSNLYSKSGIRVIRISDVQKGSISDNDIVFYPLNLKNEFENYLLTEKDILVSLTGNVGRVAMLKISNLPAALNQRVAAISTNSNVINKYLYYCISNDKFENQCYEASTGGAQKNLSTKWLANYVVPIPEIKVQEEIVKILDSFTNLIDALNEELSLRQKQFEYYREKLLTFGDNCDYVSISPIRGKRVVKDDLNDNNKYPVYQNSIEALGYYDKVNRRSNMTFIICAGAAGEIGFSTSEFWAADDCFTINHDDLLDKFIYYCIYVKKHYLKSQVRKASVPRLSNTVLSKLKLPCPPLAVQQSIVEKLDAFESLISSLKEEIALRQKQYEYYREKLLTFD